MLKASPLALKLDEKRSAGVPSSCEGRLLKKMIIKLSLPSAKLAGSGKGVTSSGSELVNSTEDEEGASGVVNTGVVWVVLPPLVDNAAVVPSVVSLTGVEDEGDVPGVVDTSVV